MRPPGCELLAWAASGSMALTGRPGEAPLVPPGRVAGRLHEIRDQILRRSDPAAPVGVPTLPEVLAGRAGALGLRRGGPVSANGSCRLLRAGGGWMALNLARAEDVDALAAVVGKVPPAAATSPWAWIEAELASADATRTAWMLDTARLLGVPVAFVADGTGRDGPGPPPAASRAGRTVPLDVAPCARPRRDPLVVDLSSLWAGPLAARLLASAGATVVKVESTGRPDGARLGSRAWYRWLHAGTSSEVVLDFGRPDGRAELRALLERADVVIEGSRPRALRAVGVGPEDLSLRPGAVWLSITGHGRAEPADGWVAFGDDAAVAGGLVARDRRGPVFVGDAIADPATGLVGALAVLEARSAGGGVLIDLAMAEVAAALAAPDPGPCAGEHRVDADGPRWVACCGARRQPVVEPAAVRP